MTGNELLADIADEVREYTNSGAEQTRMLRFLNRELSILESQLANLPGGHLRQSATFPTVASRTPNRYQKPLVIQKMEFVSRVVNSATGEYERIYPVQHVAEKDVTYVDDNECPHLISTTDTGKPRGYLLGDDFIELFPISDAVYSIRYWYMKRYDAITAADTELFIPEDFADPLIEGCRLRLYKRLHMETRDIRDSVFVARALALETVVNQVVDGPKYMPLAIPPEDWH